MNKDVESIPGLTIRYTEEKDLKFLKEWLLNPSVGRWFPMSDEAEVEDSASRWIGFARYKCSLTAVMHGVPAGIATLYLHPYRRLTHQCEFGIIVSHDFRGKGVGSHLLSSLMKLAKEQFHIELIHLQVYAENPAIKLYKRFGFREFGRQNSWIREDDKTYCGRVFMERHL
jgi:putative acetyltransferase